MRDRLEFETARRLTTRALGLWYVLRADILEAWLVLDDVALRWSAAQRQGPRASPATPAGHTPASKRSRAEQQRSTTTSDRSDARRTRARAARERQRLRLPAR